MTNNFKTWHMIFGLLLGIIGATLSVIWFGWHMLLVVFLLMWSNNISIGAGK